jgi:hypothetical protein
LEAQYPGEVEFEVLSYFHFARLDSMPAAHHIFRRACPQDISRSRAVWDCERKYFDAETWRAFPSLLEDLLRRGFISLAMIETAYSKLPRMLGGLSFLDPDYAREARTSSSTLHNFMFTAALRGKNPFLAPKQVAIENARGALNLMNFLGSFDVSDLSEAEVANFYAVNNDGYHFFHYGYNLKTMWFEVFEPHRAAELRTQGMHVDRELLLADGDTATVFRLTAEEALADPYRRFCTLFFPPKPYFRFSSGEQMLLEYVLLDYSDDEATSRLYLSADAVKKRWRSIYQKVDMIAPELLPGTESGSARRRTLLHYLRHHLEELRPYREVTEGQ